MTDNPTPQNNEIDLVDLFLRTSSWLKKNIISLFNLVIQLLSWNLRFIIRYFIWIFIVTTVTVVGSYLVKKAGIQKDYIQRITISTRVLDASEVRPYIESMNQYIQAERFDYISKLSGLPIDYLRKISSIKPHYFINLSSDADIKNTVPDIDDQWSVLVSKDLDRMDLERSKLPVGSNYEVKNKVDIDRDGLLIEVVFAESESASDNQNLGEAIISYISSQKEYQEALQLKLESSTELLVRINQELSFIDTLRYAQVQKVKSNNLTQSPSVIITQKDKPEESSLFKSENSLRLYKQKQELEKGIYFKERPLIVSFAYTKGGLNSVAGYTYKAEPWRKAAIRNGLIAILLTYVLLLLLFFREKIKKELARKL